MIGLGDGHATAGDGVRPAGAEYRPREQASELRASGLALVPNAERIEAVDRRIRVGCDEGPEPGTRMGALRRARSERSACSARPSHVRGRQYAAGGPQPGRVSRPGRAGSIPSSREPKLQWVSYLARLYYISTRGKQTAREICSEASAHIRLWALEARLYRCLRSVFDLRDAACLARVPDSACAFAAVLALRPVNRHMRRRL
jgi:hypothetical protein